MSNTTPFRRTELAKIHCDSLAGKGFANNSSGLFLAGPRRVGKTTFLIEDLIPEAEKRNWLPIYIDLWGNKQVDPGLLITEAIKSAIANNSGKLNKIVKNIPVKKIKILGSIELDFSKPGLPKNITLTQLLQHLIKKTKKKILLIVDEAQHALTSESGLNAMFSIKSARDQINTSFASPELMLAFTGSNRDKLSQLVIKKDQPFFGSSITDFPLLHQDFTDFICDTINKALAPKNQFTKPAMWQAFQLIGHRPEILREIVGQTAINNKAASFSKLLKQEASLWQEKIWHAFENEFNTLPILHRSILTLLVKEADAWSPFSEKSMQYYKEKTKQKTLSISSVQTAIQSLRDREIIWQSSRGSYSLEDISFLNWMQHQVTHNESLVEV